MPTSRLRRGQDVWAGGAGCQRAGVRVCLTQVAPLTARVLDTCPDLELFAVSRAAPRPGSLIAALVGWETAGFAGALAAALALYLPSSLLLLVVGQ